MGLNDGTKVKGTEILDVYNPICGWKVRCMALYEYPEGCFFESEWNSPMPFASRVEAIAEMEANSEDMGIPTIDQVKHEAMARKAGKELT